jgi:hypothetical protein
MKKLGKLLLFLIFFGLLLPSYLMSVEAASLKFDNPTVSVANGATFQIAVTIDPGSDSLNSTDAYVTFDPTLLKANSVTAGTLFPTVSNDTSVAGKVYISGMVNNIANPVSTAGTVATITFQALKDGLATLSFDCNSSKIIKNDLNATNVIACSQNGTSAVTIGSGGEGTSTSLSPTTIPAANTGVSQLPQTGTFDNVIRVAVPGVILLLLGSMFRLFI